MISVILLQKFPKYLSVLGFFVMFFLFHISLLYFQWNLHMFPVQPCATQRVETMWFGAALSYLSHAQSPVNPELLLWNNRLYILSDGNAAA